MLLLRWTDHVVTRRLGNSTPSLRNISATHDTPGVFAGRITQGSLLSSLRSILRRRANGLFRLVITHKRSSKRISTEYSAGTVLASGVANIASTRSSRRSSNIRNSSVGVLRCTTSRETRGYFRDSRAITAGRNPDAIDSGQPILTSPAS